MAQDEDSKAAVDQIMAQLSANPSPATPRRTDKFFERLSLAIMVHNNPLGPFNIECDNDVLDSVFANFDKLMQKETKSIRFATECAKAFIRMNNTGSALDPIKELVQCLKIAEFGAKAGFATSVNAFKLEVIFGFLYNRHSKKLASFLGGFVKFIHNPVDVEYEVFKQDHIFIYTILSSLADIATLRNLIWIVQDLLERYCYVQALPAAQLVNDHEAIAAASVAGAAAMGAAGAPPAVNPAEIHLEFTSALGAAVGFARAGFKYGERVVKGLCKPAVFSCVGCVSDFGDKVETLANYIDVNAASGLYNCILCLNKGNPLDGFDDTIARIFARYKYASCKDSLGVDPEAVKIVYSIFRSECQQGLFLLTRRNTTTDEEAVLKIEKAFPHAFKGCLTAQSLQAHNERHGGLRKRTHAFANSWDDSLTAALDEDDARGIPAQLRALDLEFTTEWTYAGSLADSALVVARYLSHSIINPATREIAVKMGCSEPSARANSLLTNPKYLEQINRMLPPQGEFDGHCKHMFSELNSLLLKELQTQYSDIDVDTNHFLKTVCTYAEAVVRHAYQSRCDYDVDEHDDIVVRVSPGAIPDDTATAHYLELKRKDEEFEERRKNWTDKGVPSMVKEGYGVTKKVFSCCSTWIKSKFKSPEPELVAGVAPPVALPILLALPPASVINSAGNTDQVDDGIQRTDSATKRRAEPVQAGVAGDGMSGVAGDGMSDAKKHGGRSRKRSASKRTRRRKGVAKKQKSKKNKRQSRRKARRSSSRKAGRK